MTVISVMTVMKVRGGCLDEARSDVAAITAITFITGITFRSK